MTTITGTYHPPRTFIFKSGSRVQIVWQEKYKQWQASYHGPHIGDGLDIYVGVSTVSARRAVRDLRLEKARKEDPKFSAVHDRLVGSNLDRFVVPDPSQVLKGATYFMPGITVKGTYSP